MSNTLEHATDAIRESVGAFVPENVEDLGSWLAALPSVWEALAESISTVAERFGDEFPLHPAVVDHLHEMAGTAAGQQEYAGEAHGIFRTTHEAELARLENPRPGESLWDTVENQ